MDACDDQRSMLWSASNLSMDTANHYEWTLVTISAQCYGPLLISVWVGAGLLFRSQTWGERVAALGGSNALPPGLLAQP